MKQLSSDAFLEACGGRTPLDVQVTSPDGRGPVRELLGKPYALIGRHGQADVCLRDANVSRRHALIQMVAGRIYCIDLCSRTGTYSQGIPQRSGWLRHLQPLQVGPFQLCFACQDAPSTTLADSWDPFAKGSQASSGLPSILLHIANGRKVCNWRMNRVVAICGSADTCKVCLRGPGVSRFHCALVSTPSGIWVLDLYRRGGINVNGILVRHALLEHGDRMQIGNYQIVVNYDAPPSSTNAIAEVARQQRCAALVSAPSYVAVTPGGSAAEGLSAELLGSLLQQFGQMQHQMFEQSLAMMFRMFQTMQGEQVAILRQELGRLDELNRELQTLLAARMQAAPVNATTPDRTHVPAPSIGAPSPRREAVTHSPRSTPAASGNTRPDKHGTGAPSAESAAPRPTPAATIEPPGESGQDVHLWLCQRMEAIQRERQGLWQKIVGALTKNN
jgi:pSer/pThr/pTyr-binding forkhead associated (FHA) protein